METLLINKIVSDYPGLTFARNLAIELNKLIPFMDDSKAWFELVKESGILQSHELSDLRTLVFAISERA